MAKIYRRQRHSRDGDDSASDDDEEGLFLKTELMTTRADGSFDVHVLCCDRLVLS